MKWYKIIFNHKTVFTSSLEIAREIAEGRQIYDVGTLKKSYLSKLKRRKNIEVLEAKK